MYALEGKSITFMAACMHFSEILPLQAVLGGTRKVLRHTENAEHV